MISSLVRVTLGPRLACVHGSSAAVPTLVRGALASSLSKGHITTVDKPSVEPHNRSAALRMPGFYPSPTCIAASAFPSSRTLQRSRSSLQQPLVRLTASMTMLARLGFPCRPWRTNVALCSAPTTATLSFTIGDSEDDTQALVARWELHHRVAPRTFSSRQSALPAPRTMNSRSR